MYKLLLSNTSIMCLKLKYYEYTVESEYAF